LFTHSSLHVLGENFRKIKKNYISQKDKYCTVSLGIHILQSNSTMKSFEEIGANKAAAKN
jgi:hypothetical protein